MKQWKSSRLISAVVYFFRLTLNRRIFWCAFTVMLVLCMTNTLVWAYACRGVDVSQQPAAANTFILRTDSPLHYILVLGVIFLMLLPYAFSYRRDARLHVDQLLIVKMGKRVYYLAHMITCFLSTFVVLFVPLAVENLINSLLFKNPFAHDYTYTAMATITGDSVGIDTVRSAVPFLRLYMDFPLKYNMLYAFFFAAFCSLLTVFVFSLSLYIKKYDIMLMLPVFLITLLQERVDILIESSGIRYFNVSMMDYITVDAYFGQSALYIICLCLLFAGTAVLLTIMKCRRDQGI